MFLNVFFLLQNVTFTSLLALPSFSPPICFRVIAYPEKFAYLCHRLRKPSIPLKLNPFNPRRPDIPMATGNLFLGTARKKLGDIVLSRRNGKQISRVRVTPKNPQSDMQTLSRLAMSTATKTAAALGQIVDHSFQGVPYGQKSVNHFVKNASKILRSFAVAAYNGENSEAAPILPYTAAGLGVAAPIVIASGDLSAGNLVPSVAGSVVKIGNIVVEGSISVGDFASIFGFPISDQITFVVGRRIEDQSAVDAESVMAGIEFSIMRLNFKENLSEEDNVFENDGAVLQIQSSLIDMERSTPGVESITISSAGNLVLGAFSGDTGSYTCAAVIVSRYENNAWRRSNATLVQGAPEGISTTAQANTAFGWNYITDLLAISRKASSVSEDRYLNKEKN